MKLVHKEQGEGSIYAIDKDKIWVLTNAAGNTCSTKKKVCKTGCGSCGTRKFERRFFISVKNPSAYVIGDQINFQRFVPEPNLVSVLVFGTPIFFTVTTMLCWLLTAPQKIESAPALLSAAAAFFGSFFILMIIDTRFKKRYPAAIIDDRYPDDKKNCSTQLISNSFSLKESC